MKHEPQVAAREKTVGFLTSSSVLQSNRTRGLVFGEATRLLSSTREPIQYRKKMGIPKNVKREKV